MVALACMLLTKITAAQNEVALTYHRVRGLYSLEVNLAGTTLLEFYTE